MIALSGIRARTICRWYQVSNRFLFALRDAFHYHNGGSKTIRKVVMDRKMTSGIIWWRPEKVYLWIHPHYVAAGCNKKMMVK